MTGNSTPIKDGFNEPPKPTSPHIPSPSDLSYAATGGFIAALSFILTIIPRAHCAECLEIYIKEEIKLIETGQKTLEATIEPFDFRDIKPEKGK